MCFSPIVSLTTAVIEFIIGTYILSKFKTKSSKYWAFFIYLLGLFQLTEILMCSYGEIYARIGFIIISVLPASGLHFFIKMSRKRFNGLYLYMPWTIISIFALFHPHFVLNNSCNLIFDTVKTIFMDFSSNIILSILFYSYYFGFILLCGIIGYIKIKEQKSKKEKQKYKLLVYSILSSLIPALLLVIIFPSFGIMFPSIYCEFAVLFTIFAILYLRIEEKEQS
jgi:hypothetical protein